MLELLSSQFAPETWRQFVHDLEHHEFKLTDWGAQEVLLGAAEQFAGEFPPYSSRGTKLLQGFLTILENCVSMAKRLQRLGPALFREKIPLGSFLSGAASKRSKQLGLDVARAIIELCPGFSDWRTFIQVSGREEELDEALQKVAGAVCLPSKISLSARYRRKMTRQLAAQLCEEEPTVGCEETPFQFFSRTIASLHDKLHHHQEERQKEILEQAERLSMVMIRHAELALQEATEAGNALDAGRARAELKEGLGNLIHLHKSRRERRAQRYKEKLRCLRETLPEAERNGVKGLVQAFLSHAGLHERTVRLLEEIYQVLEGAIELVNPAAQLKLIDGLIGELYAVSVSLAVAGPIGAGKSTIVNCVVGSNISPQRTDTMTAIPIRYVHDASCSEPTMLVPFAEQLNEVLGLIREAISSDGKEWIRPFLAKVHLSELLNQIEEGLEIRSTYHGNCEIVKASIQIHDLFRLAVNDVFDDSLLGSLPLDWGQGLDTYLTVRVCFSGLEFLSGIVEFAIVDTPGINEAGVQKLSLSKTISDALHSCKYAALATTAMSYSDKSHAPLVSMLHEIKTDLRTPMMSIVSFSEQVQKKDEGTVKRNIVETLIPESKERIFDLDSVFLVSGLRKILGTRMLGFLVAHQRKPSLDGEGEEERLLAEEWAHSAGFGDSAEDKLRYYESISLSQLEERSKKLVHTSNMNTPIHRMALDAISRGIPTSASHALRKACHELHPFFLRLRWETPVQRLRELSKRGMIYIERLTSAQHALLREANERSNKLKQKIRGQAKVIRREILSWQGPLRPNDANSRPFLCIFLRQVRKTNNLKALELVEAKEKSPVFFASQKEAEEALSCLGLALKRAIEEYILSQNENLPFLIQRCCQVQKDEVRKSFEKISQFFSDNLGLDTDKKLLETLANNQPPSTKIPEPSQTLEIDPSIQRIIRKKHKKASLITLHLRQMEERKVQPKEMRTILQEKAEQTHAHALDLFEAKIDFLLEENLAPYIKECTEASFRLQKLVRQQLAESQNLSMERSLGSLSGGLGGCLSRARDLVSTFA